uniref:hypothetical protein n=1 Tax=Salmonella sp. s51228 TaxID=3159652 RepID=UPI0039809C8F
LHATADLVIFDKCLFISQFIARVLYNFTTLDYIYIIDRYLKSCRTLCNQPTLNADFIQLLKKKQLKGIYLTFVTLDESALYHYLSTQTSLTELELEGTTSSTLSSCNSIQHLTSLIMFTIRATDAESSKLEEA